MWNCRTTDNRMNETAIYFVCAACISVVCLGKSHGIEPVGALFLSEDDNNWKINTISSVATERWNSFHTVHLSSLHAGASRNLSGRTVCNQ
jgi:hypothetical protein